MGGPPPKPANLRQRRNRQSTAAKLTDDNAENDVPALPPIREWNQATRAEWESIWTSPMASEYIDADYHGLLKLAMLIDDFFEAESTTGRRELAVEIRLQRADFGLAPLGRARLHWEIARGDEAEAKRTKQKQRESPAAPSPDTADPRARLGRQGGFDVLLGGKA